MCLQEIVVANRREVPDEAPTQRHGQIAQDGEEPGVGPFFPEPSRVVGEIGERMGTCRLIKENRVDEALGEERPGAFQPRRTARAPPAAPRLKSRGASNSTSWPRP